ncbi:endopeptidase La [Thiomicrospira cyclica]|uniref:Lon protease n=1 Tax=Thiomicrospira cyclica (strain DSM 14477 / JCM 11371 / ALM1) TaxID=717773 RepID=F6DBA3_THICA|nr:endopeptidase La [Thiomicrospira cyclica]AEG31211.1 anti-sigma H sporulation factor, LonB [Thiomicrospira cyclica ALM1]
MSNLNHETPSSTTMTTDTDPNLELPVALESASEHSGYPETLYLIPIKDRPFFPGQTLPVVLNKKAWLKTFRAIQKSSGPDYVGIVYVDNDDHQNALPNEFRKIGTLVKMTDVKIKDQYIQFIAEGVCRFQIEDWVNETSPYATKVTYPTDIRTGTDQEYKAYGLAIMNAFRELLPLNPLYSEELRFFLNRYNPEDPQQLADFAAAVTTSKAESLQDVLETLDLVERLEKVLALFKHEIEVTRLQFSIRERVEENMTEYQKHFFLRQQLKEIQKELGIQQDSHSEEVERFEQRLDSLKLPDDSAQKIHDEINKLRNLDQQSSEYGVTRNWLDWATQLPWQHTSQDKLDLSRAERLLNRAHYGLDDVKERILEFLALSHIRGKVAGSIMCFVGPPGVGKTSIGRSIADALGRQFYRFSVGGMRDEAEIKGHRRTYIGAMPGKFIQALKDCKTANPVILIDEIDKMGASYQGDPASALLEVLDPEQNQHFLDHFLDLQVDLSQVLFICTANQLDTIPTPLLDRMEVIRLSGYITEEKTAIAQKHLWPGLLKETGITKQQVQLSRAAIVAIIEGYARESGVRNLQKQLAKLMRKAAMRLVKEPEVPIKITPKTLVDFLGTAPFNDQHESNQIGTITGLAWTSMGGATLNIEATRVHSHAHGIKLSGQLGKVMQESAELAYSFVQSHTDDFGIANDFFETSQIHLHVPDGATPKDGPSAGITMACALVSLATQQPIQRDLAMTGELSLVGRVMPVGGIREKLVAAKRAKIFEVILPAQNARDVEKLPEYLLADMKIHYVKHFNEVASLCFEPSKTT